MSVQTYAQREEELMAQHCFSSKTGACPLRIASIDIDFDRDKYGTVTLEDGRVFYNVRKPTEPCSHICNLIGCETRLAIEELWHEEGFL